MNDQPAKPPRKLPARVDENAAMTALKSLPKDALELVYERCCGKDMSQPEIREWVQKEYGITLTNNTQLSRFKDWMWSRECSDYVENLLDSDEAKLVDLFPAVPRENVRRWAIDRALVISDKIRNASGILKAVSGDQKERELILKERVAEQQAKSLDLMERRIVLLENKAAEAKEALTTIARTGGLSPEALAQIEAAAKLL